MNVSVQEILTQAFGFAVLFFILKKHAWKPVLALLDARRQKIASGFSEIEKTRAELTALKTEYDKRLVHIEEEARAKLEQVVLEGKKVAREIQDSARNQAKAILEKSKEDIELETAKARVTLQKEIAGLVSLATERIVHEKFTDKKDEELIVRFIKDLENSKESLVK